MRATPGVITYIIIKGEKRTAEINVTCHARKRHLEIPRKERWKDWNEPLIMAQGSLLMAHILRYRSCIFQFYIRTRICQFQNPHLKVSPHLKGITGHTRRGFLSGIELARESLLAGLLAGRGMGMHASKGSSLSGLSYGTGMKEMSQAGNGSGSHYYLVTEMIIDECGQGSKKKVP